MCRFQCIRHFVMSVSEGAVPKTGNGEKISMIQHLNNQCKTSDFNMQNKAFFMQCIYFTIFMRCILMGLILMHQGLASDQYHSILGQIHWSKMPSSSGHNCSRTAITVLHSRLVSPSSCSFLPHAKLSRESCASVWRPWKHCHWQPQTLISSVFCAIHSSYWALNKKNGYSVSMEKCDYIPCCCKNCFESLSPIACQSIKWNEICIQSDKCHSLLHINANACMLMKILKPA